MHAFALALLLAQAPAAAPAPAGNALSNDPFPPHRIADNLYYVGSKGLATYLITSKKGHILINPSFDRTVPLIKASVEQLGFKLSDVKIILNSHAHGDHVEGMAMLKELTGADVYVMQGDEKVVETGGEGQYLGGKSRWKAAPIKRVLKDGDKVTLGDATLVARRTPGHTRGCTTWTMKAKDAGKTLNVVVVGSPNINPGYQLVDNKDYPEIATDYATAFKIWKALPCDIFLGAHGNYYGMEEKYARLKKGEKNPFVDPAGYKAYIEEREQNYHKVLAEQQAKKGRTKGGTQ
jgi:metallo-beta-lactamase class B